MLKTEKLATFKKALRDYKRTYRLRDLPWRNTTDPYKIAVSELMLQQTQVPRVIEKYSEFIKSFPNIQSLAKAPLSRVLTLWSGLGYNRRAKFLHMLAQTVVAIHKGVFPKTIPELEELPGIGPYTARAIAAFAYNIPSVCIETNIRTVFIHHFYNDIEAVSDKELMLCIEQALDTKNPREWYWLLMDYGTYLKSTGVRTHRKSVAYVKQSTFVGSRRQIRGMLMKLLLEKPHTAVSIAKQTGKEREVVRSVLGDLITEGFVCKKGLKYHII